MKANEVKPGTRCECRAKRCADNCREHLQRYPDTYQCYSDAVRLVTVRESATREGTMVFGPHEIPLCAACAEYHEKGARRA